MLRKGSLILMGGVVLLLPGAVFGADPTFGFASRMGGTDMDLGISTAVDASGNVYTTGLFTGTADFDPGAGTANLTSAGLQDIFVSKLNASGALVWAKRLGGAEDESGYSIAVDGSGNVYITGYFSGTVDFDPGAGTANLTSAGLDDIFVSKLDASGALVWVRRLGGTNSDVANSIAVDGAGNVYTTGTFQGTADFDPGAGTANLTSVNNNDIFVSKLDASGTFVWAQQLGGPRDDYGASIAVDGAGNVYTTGNFFGTADFDPGAGTANLTSAGGLDIFVSKLDASGAFVWARRLGGADSDEGTSIAVDGAGNVYTTGGFHGTADFDPGAGTANLTSADDVEIFVSKLNASGAFVWAQRLGGTSADDGASIAVDGASNVYTTGYFFGTADFDPGAGTANLTSAGLSDAFVSKLNASGAFVWAQRVGGADYDYGSSIVVDGVGNVYTTGNFRDTADFDPGAGTAYLTSAGLQDIFVSKLTIPSGLDLTFNACNTNAGHSSSTLFDCSSSQVQNLYGCFQVHDAQDSVVAMEFELFLGSAAPLPNFWHFEPGGCNESGIQLSPTRPSGVCSNATATWPAGSVNSFVYQAGYGNDPTIGHLKGDIARPTPIKINAGTNYFGFQLALDLGSAEESGGSCEGCPQPMAILWSKATLYNVRSTGPSSYAITGPGLVSNCVAINGGGSYCSTLSTVSVPRDPSSKLSLYAGPNPTSGDVRIEYGLARPDRARIDVVDLSGRSVCTVLERFVDAGAGSAVWNGRGRDGSRVRPGVYWLRLRSGHDETIVRRLVFLR